MTPQTLPHETQGRAPGIIPVALLAACVVIGLLVAGRGVVGLVTESPESYNNRWPRLMTSGVMIALTSSGLLMATRGRRRASWVLLGLAFAMGFWTFMLR